jgi:Cdc6-like AAA superfamily ATPase
MTIEIVRQRLDAAISDETPKVILLTGGWGAGKTYQWRDALKRGQKSQKNLKCAYVSLFGIGTLAEAKKRLSEELVSVLSLPDGAGTVGGLVSEASTKLKPLQMVKLLPLIPYLGKAEGLLNELSFSVVRDAVVCIDDLERKSNGLSIADVFGLASFLKEERKCRVILIANNKKFDEEGTAAASVYLEKVIDEHVNFAPTPQEACEIALGQNPDRPRVMLREHLLRLEVSNIRVIRRLSQLVDELATAIDGLDEEVLKIGARQVKGQSRADGEAKTRREMGCVARAYGWTGQ